LDNEEEHVLLCRDPEGAPTVRFTYAEAMTDARFYLPLAQAAEAAGYSSITVADSVAYPKDSDSTYPYTADGSRTFLEDKEFIETFVLCAAMVAVTTTLRFTPFVLKLPVRPPVPDASRPRP
jgi:alkanesulfonate monooxygenase SsuD/methylene tetrahydromethanopterin reductase-like flavin-dependent oxidoreductase (luciferase family)